MKPNTRGHHSVRARGGSPWGVVSDTRTGLSPTRWATGNGPPALSPPCRGLCCAADTLNQHPAKLSACTPHRMRTGAHNGKFLEEKGARIFWRALLSTATFRARIGLTAAAPHGAGKKERYMASFSLVALGQVGVRATAGSPGLHDRRGAALFGCSSLFSECQRGSFNPNSRRQEKTKLRLTFFFRCMNDYR